MWGVAGECQNIGKGRSVAASVTDIADTNTATIVLWCAAVEVKVFVGRTAQPKTPKRADHGTKRPLHWKR